MKVPPAVTRSTIVIFSLDIALAAFAFSIMPWYLFGVSGADGRTLLTAVLVAFLLIGSWMLAYLPLAATAWAVTVCLGTVITLALDDIAFFNYTALLMGFLGLVAVATVLTTSRIFLSNLKAEAEIAQQKQLVGLLLNDFEEHSSDWLWETDGQGRLRHVATRLAQNLGADKTRITLNPLADKKMADLPKPTGEIQLLVGAEGGLSASEIVIAAQHGFIGVHLGKRILRTETAPLAAIATANTLWGDF